MLILKYSGMPKSELVRISDIRLSFCLKKYISNRTSEIQTFSSTSLDRFIYFFQLYKTTYASGTSSDFGRRGCVSMSGNGTTFCSDFNRLDFGIPLYA